MDLYKQQFLWLAIIIAVVAILLLLWQLIRRNRAPKTSCMDELEGHDFEQFCAELLENKGFVDVEVTKGSGDYGIDILAEKDGVTYAIQCKRYQGPVGVEAVQQAYAGRDYYDRMVGAVMTNQYFTAPAVSAAKRLKILLWDRGYIDSMMEEDER